MKTAKELMKWIIENQITLPDRSYFLKGYVCLSHKQIDELRKEILKDQYEKN